MAMHFENIPRGRAGPPSDFGSVATTQLASEVGSVVGTPADAFLRSITFFKDQPDMEWGIQIADPLVQSKTTKLMIQSVEGSVALSRIQPGDYLKTVNGKRIGPSYNAERAMDLMKDCLARDKVLSVEVGNKSGKDTLVQATILKPDPDMTYEDLGMVVWYWGTLCIKSIGKDSIFKQTALKANDHIVSINDILCEEVTPEQFAQIIGTLPLEVTIVVRRAKQRWTGKFG
eukprot:scaffold13957_cov54-Attheya_sp.AAC.1